MYLTDRELRSRLTEFAFTVEAGLYLVPKVIE